MNNISVFVPVYNEEKVITDVLSKLDKYLSIKFNQYEIIVVNDGSADSSNQCILDYLSSDQSNKNVSLINNQQNLGVGHSFRKALSVAKFEYITYYPGDGEFSPDQYDNFLSHIDGQSHILSVTTNSFQTRGISRTLLSKLYTFTLNSLYRLNHKYYNGNSIFLTNELKQLELYASGFAFTSEIVIKLAKSNKKFKIVETDLTKRTDGVSKAITLKSLISVLKDNIKLFKSIYLNKSKKTA